MNDEEKLMWMFEQVHGKISISCYTEVDLEEGTVSIMKDGNLCWLVNKVDLVFDYLMKDK